MKRTIETDSTFFYAPCRQQGLKSPKGFALIATISVMVLLVMVALAMLSLSTIEMRNSRNGEHRDIAQANARMSLMLALGELQKSIGPDQRITAPSDLFAADSSSGSGVDNPYLTGVWTARDEELGETPDYDRSASFQRWLVSNTELDQLEDARFVVSGALNDEVVMVGNRAAPSAPSSEVRAGRVPLSRGKIAWWVGDENTKGYTVPSDTLVRAGGGLSIADRLEKSATPGAYGMEIIDEEYPANTPKGDKAITYQGLQLTSSKGDEAREWYHDLSPYARGVLSNVTKGGLRKDLNLYLELPRPGDAWPRRGGPAKIGPNDKYALSEFDEYDVLSWKRLHEHYHMKENVLSVGGRPSIPAYQNGQSGQLWNNGLLRPAPVVVRFQTFISFGSIRDPSDASKYVVRFYAYPVLTLWNPYNVDITVRADRLCALSTAFPMEHRISVNDIFKESYNWRGVITRDDDGVATNNNGAGVLPALFQNLVLKAGEVKMLSPSGDTGSTFLTHGIHQVHFVRDRPFSYSQSNPGGIWGIGGTQDDPIELAIGAANDRIKIETDVSLWGNGGGAYLKGYQATWDLRMSNGNTAEDGWMEYLFSGKVGWRFESSTPEIAMPNKKLATASLPEATFAEVFNAPKPFMVVDAKLKALDEEVLPNKTWRDTIPSHAFQAVTKDQEDATSYFSQAYTVSFDSINSYQEASQYLQVAPDNQTQTYFGGSHFPAEGQSFITDREIPLAPLTSIAQLQHVPQHSHDNLFSSGFYFQNRAIGNSYASPGVPADKVKQVGEPFNLDMWANVLTGGGGINGRRYARDHYLEHPNIDRSYAANHLLWDDYFFSSMAAKNSQLNSAGERKSLETVVRDFYEQGKDLPNSRYRPYVTGTTSDVVSSLTDGGQPAPDAYKEVASHLTVDGMFNINSTSVKAWKVLLASAHRRKMVIMETAGGAPKVDDKETRYVVSRFTMPNGGSADEAIGDEAEQLKWRGYRELSESQIDELAEAMVRQVKLRGPFRSLAEFVNRRLASESDETSHYGALQAALEDTSVTINELYRDKRITESDIEQANYVNKAAALGSRYQGSPAYVNQADILNAIGPVLSARSDTFVIRGYGESLDKDGNVKAKAWCEAVVQRVPEYMDSADAPETAFEDLTSELNKSFGRKLRMVSFRWLSQNEV